MSRLKCIAFVLALGSVFGALPVVSQTSVDRPNSLEMLNKEARASDPEGLHRYSTHLVQMFVGNSAGPAYAASLTDRLARAELAARHGKHKLISEANIAQAFKALMVEIGAPKSFVVDIDAVHSNRIAFESSLPAMISQKENGSYCHPGEAVFVLAMMIENVGETVAPTPNSASNAFVATIKPPVRVRLEQFCANHSRSEITEVFSRMFDSFQI